MHGVVVVVIMSPNRQVPFELCNTAIKEYYFKLFVTYFTCSLVSILALEAVAHFKVACVGNLAFKGDQSRNAIWQWSHGTHLDINKHNDPVMRWGQNKERENNTKIHFY